MLTARGQGVPATSETASGNRVEGPTPLGAPYREPNCGSGGPGAVPGELSIVTPNRDRGPGVVALQLVGAPLAIAPLSRKSRRFSAKPGAEAVT
ncbi:MAG: hypothetical protein ABSC94_31510 [Polyangiaceae bacterium]|jgi:hypothetical protein